METASKRDRTKEAALVQIGPPTAVIITGEWRAVVTLQIEMEESHKDTNFVHLRGTRMRTAEGFLSELAAVLQFPVWFGENWDALEDILRDRAAFAGTVIAIYNAEQLLADGSAADRTHLAEAMEECNQYWLKKDGDDDEDAGDEAFHLLLQVPEGEIADFRTRWVEAGLSIAAGDK